MNVVDSMSGNCSACGSGQTSAIYRQSSVPVHSVLNIDTREEALNCPRGELRLLHCRDCGYVFNAGFDPSLLRYSAGYEETQGFSATFNEFHRDLADPLVERYSLRGNRIVETGCGKGEFLHLPGDFLGRVREGISGRPRAIVYFQVPDAAKVFRDGAFWDIYYEHCGYHCASSLSRLFGANGFAVSRIESLYETRVRHR